MASPDVGRDVVVLRVILTATPEQLSRDVWIVIRAGKFLGTYDDLDAALRVGHQIAEEANVQCWQSDGQVLPPTLSSVEPPAAPVAAAQDASAEPITPSRERDERRSARRGLFRGPCPPSPHAPQCVG